MKKIMLAAALLLSVSAFARPAPMEMREVLTTVIENGVDNGLTAVTTVSIAKKSIEVLLYRDRCGSLLPVEPGKVRCKAMASLVDSATVPLLEQIDDGCGSTIYSGKIDHRPVDGPLVEISLTDNRARGCENVVLGAVVVNMDVTIPRPAKRTQYLMY